MGDDHLYSKDECVQEKSEQENKVQKVKPDTRQRYNKGNVSASTSSSSVNNQKNNFGRGIRKESKRQADAIVTHKNGARLREHPAIDSVINQVLPQFTPLIILNNSVNSNPDLIQVMTTDGLLKGYVLKDCIGIKKLQNRQNSQKWMFVISKKVKVRDKAGGKSIGTLEKGAHVKVIGGPVKAKLGKNEYSWVQIEATVRNRKRGRKGKKAEHKIKGYVLESSLSPLYYTLSPRLPRGIRKHYKPIDKQRLIGPWIKKFAEDNNMDVSTPIHLDKALIKKIKDYQKSHKITRDGLVGQEMIYTMMEDEAKKEAKKQHKDKTELDEIKEAVFDRTVEEETGGKKSKDEVYGTWQAYDKGLLSYGFIQFTLDSGSLQEVLHKYVKCCNKKITELKKYVKVHGSKDPEMKKRLTVCNTRLSKMNKYLKDLPEIKKGIKSYRKSSPKDTNGYVRHWRTNLKKNYIKGWKFGKFLKSLGGDECMQNAQREEATYKYWMKSTGLAGMYGVQSKFGLMNFFDATVNNGGKRAELFANRAMLNKEEIWIKVKDGKKNKKKRIVIPEGKVGDKTNSKDFPVITEDLFVVKFAKERVLYRIRTLEGRAKNSVEQYFKDNKLSVSKNRKLYAKLYSKKRLSLLRSDGVLKRYRAFLKEAVAKLHLKNLEK